MNKGVTYLVLFSLLTGMGGFFVKMTGGLSAEQILFLRSVVVCVSYLIYAYLTNKQEELKLKYPLATLVMGAVEGLSIYFYYRALETTAITNTTLLVYTAPIFSVILSAIFLKEKIVRRTLWGVLLAFVGVVIVSEPSKLVLAPSAAMGSIYALLGGIFYAAMAVSSKNVVDKTTPLYAAFWQYLVIAIMSVPFVFPLSTGMVMNNLLPILYLGIAAGSVAFFLYMKGVGMVKGQIIQVVTMLEIVVASLSGILLLGESLTVSTIIGGSLILSGIWVVSGKGK